MAQRTEIVFTDDLDGGPADETVRFGIDGTQYEIDLSKAHAGELRSVLQPYVASARRVTAGGAGASRRARAGRRPGAGRTRRTSGPGRGARASRSRTRAGSRPSSSSSSRPPGSNAAGALLPARRPGRRCRRRAGQRSGRPASPAAARTARVSAPRLGTHVTRCGARSRSAPIRNGGAGTAACAPPGSRAGIHRLAGGELRVLRDAGDAVEQAPRDAAGIQGGGQAVAGVPGGRGRHRPPRPGRGAPAGRRCARPGDRRPARSGRARRTAAATAGRSARRC